MSDELCKRLARLVVNEADEMRDAYMLARHANPQSMFDMTNAELRAIQRWRMLFSLVVNVLPAHVSDDVRRIFIETEASIRSSDWNAKSLDLQRRVYALAKSAIAPSPQSYFDSNALLEFLKRDERALQKLGEALVISAVSSDERSSEVITKLLRGER